jgi:carboxylesterase
MSKIIPSAEPFFFPGGSTGCLLIHGFTGTPKEMRGMGEYLNQQGYSVLGVRLAGHATIPEDLSRTRWEDWLTSAENGLHLLKDATDQVFVCGLSMGGILSLLLAAEFQIAGVIAMSTPYELPPDPRVRYIRLLQYLIPNIPKGEPDWQEASAAENHIDYPYYPTRAVIELGKLMEQMRGALPRVTAPLLLIHSKDDKGIAPENMKKIYQNAGSQQKEMAWIEHSGHTMTRDGQFEQVFSLANQFIQKHQV